MSNEINFTLSVLFTVLSGALNWLTSGYVSKNIIIVVNYGVYIYTKPTCVPMKVTDTL